jgi:AcrR family transcriptional regulator
MDKDLDRNDWLKAARLALLTGGVEAVRVEKLARNLSVTKGSFYWHFKDREELLALLLREWEEELQKDIIPRLKGRRGPEALRLLLQLMVARVSLSEEGDLPSDAAIFTWASVSPKVAQRVNQVVRDSRCMADRPEGDGALATGVGQHYRGNDQSSVRCHRR